MVITCCTLGKEFTILAPDGHTTIQHGKGLKANLSFHGLHAAFQPPQEENLPLLDQEKCVLLKARHAPIKAEIMTFSANRISNGKRLS